MQSGEGAMFADIPPQFPDSYYGVAGNIMFACTVWPAGEQPTKANAEIVGVFQVFGDTISFYRAPEAEGGTPRTILIGDQIAVTITERMLRGFDRDGYVERPALLGCTAGFLDEPWENVGVLPGSYAAAFEVLYLENGILLVSVNGPAEAGHVLRSTDYGATWSDIAMPTTNTDPFGVLGGGLCYMGNGIVVYGCGDLGLPNTIVYRSTDFGATWVQVEFTGFSDTGLPVVITYLGTDNVVFGGVAIALTQNGHIVKTTDYGVTWTDIGAIVDPAGIYNNVISLLNLGNGIVLMGAGSHVWKSLDWGSTWTDKGELIGSWTLTYVGSLCHLGNGRVLAGGKENPVVFRSDDWGETWQGGQIWDQVGAGVATSIADIVYLGGGVVLLLTAISAFVYISTDFGHSWRLRSQLTAYSDFYPAGLVYSGHEKHWSLVVAQDNSDSLIHAYRSQWN